MWWSSMSAFQQTLFVLACAATFVLVMQIVLMLIGNASDADIDASDGDISGGGITDVDGADDVLDVSGGGALDVDGDSDISDHGASVPFGLRLLSLRSIIAFVAIGGWVGYTVCYALDWYYALIIALACGFAAACAMAAAMLGMEKLQSNGNLNPLNAVGKTGTVYLTVPPERSGKGKVNILIQERYAEYEAVTDSGSPLPTASEIKVIGHVGANVLIVEKYKKPSITIENN